MKIIFSKLIILLIAGFIRPVVLLGPIADITRDKLLQDMPDRFAIPSKKSFHICGTCWVCRVSPGFHRHQCNFVELEEFHWCISMETSNTFFIRKTLNTQQELLSTTFCYKNVSAEKALPTFVVWCLRICLCLHMH